MAKPLADLKQQLQQRQSLTITEEYRKLNRQLHETRPDYGTSGQRWGSFVGGLAAAAKVESILDYGAGKQTLANALPQFTVKSYDPAVPGIDTSPEPADLVVCTDVMEHIEPERLDAVLNDLKRVTKRIIFMTVATRPAQKTLSDGRNAHLIQQTYEWWLPRIWSRFEIDQFQNMERKEFLIVGRAKS